MDNATRERMKRFFAPQHIVVVGASTKNHWFANMVNNARRSGFKGEFLPVNPNAPEVCGIRTYPSIADLPDGRADFGVVIVKSSMVPGTLEGLLDKGVRDVLLITSGYAELGPEGKAMQDGLARFCLDNGIRLMGPNCLGFMNLTDSVSVFAGGSVEGEMKPGPVAHVGQSGASSEIIATKLLKKSLGLSLYAATGNEAMLTAEDCYEYLVNDPNTRVITGFMEGFRNIDRMKDIAVEAARKKIPIILIKVGSSEKGKQAARSHTGALAGNDAAMEGFFRQYGIIRVDTIEELAETAGIFAMTRLPEGGGLGIITFSGGLCGLYADLCAKYGIDLPPLSERTVAALKAILPDFAQPDNPLDVTGSGFSQGFGQMLKIMLEDEGIDIIAPLSFAPAGDDDVMFKLFNGTIFPLAQTSKKPVIAITFREVTDYARRYYHENGMYYIEHPEDSFKAIAHFLRYAEFQRKLAESVSLKP